MAQALAVVQARAVAPALVQVVVVGAVAQVVDLVLAPEVEAVVGVPFTLALIMYWVGTCILIQPLKIGMLLIMALESGSGNRVQ